jgi:hypothetical protein
MGVSGWVHAIVTLPLRNDLQYPQHRMLGGPQSQVECRGKETKQQQSPRKDSNDNTGPFPQTFRTTLYTHNKINKRVQL